MRYLLGRSPSPLNAGEDCLLSNQLSYDIGCPGANDDECTACTCDNDCKVRNCDNVRDHNGKLCSSNCGCTPDVANSSQGGSGDGGSNDTFDAAGRNTGTSTSVNTGTGGGTAAGTTTSGSGGTGGNLEDGGE